MGSVIQSIEGEGLSYHTFEDIGKYTVFPENMFKRMFPGELFGRYQQDEYNVNRTYGIMTREEGLRLTNELSRLTLPSARKVDYKEIVSLPSNSEVKRLVI